MTLQEVISSDEDLSSDGPDSQEFYTSADLADASYLDHKYILQLIEKLISEKSLVCLDKKRERSDVITPVDRFDCIKSTYIGDDGKKEPVYLLTDLGLRLVILATDPYDFSEIPKVKVAL